VGAFAAFGATLDQAPDGWHGDVRDHDGPHGRPGLHILAHITAATGFVRGPVDSHVLAAQIDVANWDGDRFLPPQAGEGKAARCARRGPAPAPGLSLGEARPARRPSRLSLPLISRAHFAVPAVCWAVPSTLALPVI
jgi:hypothetical protein